MKLGKVSNNSHFFFFNSYLDDSNNTMDSINAMNNLGIGYLPHVSATDLQPKKSYPAEIIKLVKTRYGDAYVVTSSDFQLFLPKAFTAVKIPEYMKNRSFKVERIETFNGRPCPKYSFAVDPVTDDESQLA